MMQAAARIQSHFRTCQTRRNFMNLRRQAIKIQAAYRGHQVRRQYCKVIWSVGFVEKAICDGGRREKDCVALQLECQWQWLQLQMQKQQALQRRTTTRSAGNKQRTSLTDRWYVCKLCSVLIGHDRSTGE